jgi:alanine racemase
MNVATLTVDLSALVANWQMLSRLHGGETAAVVKANAYGLGAEQAVEALKKAGCKRFFVATLAEAINLQHNLKLPPCGGAAERKRSEVRCVGGNNIAIYVFQGVLKGEEKEYLHYGLNPVINHVGGLKSWLEVQQNAKPAALHIDSGMNRLGLCASDLQNAEVLRMAKALKADLLMTHYASASNLAHPQNQAQLDIMQQIEAHLPHLTTCYANSAAHFLPRNFHGAVSRPGCALYGINPLDDAPAPMQPVAELTAPILQLRTLQKHEVVGYGATETLPKGSIILTAGIGYADGIHRQASHRLHGFISEYRLPQIGRITMDMTCYDATNVPETILQKANHLTIMDKRNQTVNHLAQIYNTIGYEVLTSIGARVKRNYV